MDRQSLSKHERETRASEELADRLDALSRPLAERVLGRAIELQAIAEDEARDEANKISYDDLKKIALEVGIPEDALQKALLEELDTDKDHGVTPTERITGPQHVRGGVIVDMDEDEIRRRLRTYFEEQEGLELAGRAGEWIWWRRGGPYRDRVIESVLTEQERGERRLVEIDLDTAEARRKAVRTAVAFAILIFLFGGPLGFAVITILGVALVTAGGFFISAVRRFVRRARRRINHALDSLLEASRDSDDWLEVIEEAFEKLIDD